MHAISVCVVMVRPSRAAVGVAETQPDFLPVFFVDAMVMRDRISTRAVLWTVDGNAVQCESNLPSFWRTSERTVGFRTIGGIMATRGVIHR